MNLIEWLNPGRIGLMLNTAGAILLIIGSNKVVGTLTNFVDTVSSTYGTYGQGSVVPKVKQLAEKFQQEKRRANVINLVGYGLFIAGFILQLI